VGKEGGNVGPLFTIFTIPFNTDHMFTVSKTFALSPAFPYQAGNILLTGFIPLLTWSRRDRVQ